MSQYILEDCPCCEFIPCGACPDREEYADELASTCHFFREAIHTATLGQQTFWDLSHYNQSILLPRLTFPTVPFGWAGQVAVPSRVPGAFPGTLDVIGYTVVCADDNLGLHWRMDVRTAQVSQFGGPAVPLFHFRARCFIPPEESPDPGRTCGKDGTPSLVLTWDADWELLSTPFQHGGTWTWNDVPLLVALE